MTTDSPHDSHEAPGGTVALIAELERHLLARQAQLARHGAAAEPVRRAALPASDASLGSLLDRLGAVSRPVGAGTAAHADEAA